MSTLSVSDLMRELQAGEEARAKIPQLEAFNTQLTADINKANSRNMGLEENIIGYKRTIEELSSKVRSLEVERDDAGFRELEAAERLNTLKLAVASSSQAVLDALNAIDPPKPEPVAQQPVQDASVPMTEAQAGSTNVPITDHGGERVADPTSAPTTGSPQSADAISSGAEPTSSASAAEPGQSDPHPTAPSTEATLPPASGDAASPSVTAPSMSDPQAYRPFGGDAVGADKPNAGKAYWERPDGMSWADWQASGGSI